MTALEGRCVVLTGAGRGIGRALAVACARADARLILNARSTGDLEETTALVRQAGGTAVAIAGDVADPQTGIRLAQTAIETFGGCDFLGHLAARSGPIGEVENLDVEAFADTLRVNILGTFLVCRAFAPLMKARRSGRIVTVASGLAEYVQPGQSAYSASKAAVVQFTRVMASELATYGVTANVVHPGVVRTGMVDELLALPRVGVGHSIAERMEALSSSGALIDPDYSARFFMWMFTEYAGSGDFVRITDPEPAAFLKKVVRS
jgi:3-oxoacyl-[acyl-carrier protein] reductase